MAQNLKILGVIPARYASSRLPGKPLADLCGKSLIMHVFDNAVKSAVFDMVIVATDDQRIADHCHDHNARVVMTSAEHQSGTSRCLEAYEKARKEWDQDWDVVINIQGDEPILRKDDLQMLVKPFPEGFRGIATLAAPIQRNEDLHSPNVVKLVENSERNAMYFSRSPIPFQRDKADSEWLEHHTYHKHIGIYAYSSLTLQEICELPPDPLEMSESLEQLRWLSAGHNIRVLHTDHEGIGIDTPGDLERARKILKKGLE